MNKNTLIDTFFFCFNLFVSYIFSLLSAFLSSKPFRNNYMHREIIDSYFNTKVWAPKAVDQSPK